MNDILQNPIFIGGVIPAIIIGVYNFSLKIIAKNLAINEYNRRKRLQSFDPAETPQVFGQEESNVENQMMVEEMLSSLSDLEREIVTLHVLGDLKHREIAEIVGKPLGTVTWTYQQAIKKMKQQFGEVVES